MDELTEQLSLQQEFDRAELKRAIREVFELASGKRVLFWMLEQCAIYSDAFTGDSDATNYTLGLQAAGRRVIAQLDEIDARLYPRLLLDIADLKEMDRAAVAAKKENDHEDDD